MNPQLDEDRLRRLRVGGGDASTTDLNDRRGGHFFVEDFLEHQLVDLLQPRQRRCR